MNMTPLEANCLHAMGGVSRRAPSDFLRFLERYPAREAEKLAWDMEVIDQLLAKAIRGRRRAGQVRPTVAAMRELREFIVRRMLFNAPVQRAW